MPRRVKREKPYIIVFCEGESEQAYADFLKREFRDVAVIQRPKSTGTFDEAGRRFRNDHKYLNNAEVMDEIWFFFDVETVDIPKWSDMLRIISRLRKLRKKPGIPKMFSVTTAPEINHGIDIKTRTVTMISALHSTCFTITVFLGTPFASAVVTNFSFSTSSTSALISRIVPATLPSVRETTGRIKFSGFS